MSFKKYLLPGISILLLALIIGFAAFASAMPASAPAGYTLDVERKGPGYIKDLPTGMEFPPAGNWGSTSSTSTEDIWKYTIVKDLEPTIVLDWTADTGLAPTVKPTIAFKVEPDVPGGNPILLAYDFNPPGDIWDVLHNKAFLDNSSTQEHFEALDVDGYTGYWGKPGGREIAGGGFTGYDDANDKNFFFFADEPGVYTITIALIDAVDGEPLLPEEVITVAVGETLTVEEPGPAYLAEEHLGTDFENGYRWPTTETDWTTLVKDLEPAIVLDWTAAMSDDVKPTIAFTVDPDVMGANPKLLAYDHDPPGDIWDVLHNIDYLQVNFNDHYNTLDGDYTGYWGHPGGRDISLEDFTGYTSDHDKEFYFFADEPGEYEITIALIDAVTGALLAKVEEVEVTVEEEEEEIEIEVLKGITLTKSTFDPVAGKAEIGAVGTLTPKTNVIKVPPFHVSVKNDFKESIEFDGDIGTPKDDFTLISIVHFADMLEELGVADNDEITIEQTNAALKLPIFSTDPAINKDTGVKSKEYTFNAAFKAEPFHIPILLGNTDPITIVVSRYPIPGPNPNPGTELLTIEISANITLASGDGLTYEDVMARAVDPQSWQANKDKTWDDFKPNPVIDWIEDLEEEGLANAKAISENRDPQQSVRGAVILVDYLDKPFISSFPEGTDDIFGFHLRDKTGWQAAISPNPQLRHTDRDTLGKWWADYLNEKLNINNGSSNDEFWRENSYGKMAVDLIPYGPYTLQGLELQYGGLSTNARPPSLSNRPSSLLNEAIELARAGADGKAAWDPDEFDFFFIIHAGYDESGIWLPFGMMQWPAVTLDDARTIVPDKFGPQYKLAELAGGYNGTDLELLAKFADPLSGLFDGPNSPEIVEILAKQSGANAYIVAEAAKIAAARTAGTLATYNFEFPQSDWDWAKTWGNADETRYVAWTSWAAALTVWSGAGAYNYTDSKITGGNRSIRRSIQGENDGMATFAHEFGHISGLPDNYGNPYTDRASARTEPWELMSRGSFAGPFGDQARWTVPGTEAGSVPVHYMAFNKTNDNMYDPGDVLEIDVDKLASSTPVVTEIVARNIPLNNRVVGTEKPYQWLEDDYGLSSSNYYKALRLNFGSNEWSDQAGSTANRKTTGFSWNQASTTRMFMEVVQRTGYDSYAPDDGVIISRDSRVVDSHLYDIAMIDYVQKDGFGPGIDDYASHTVGSMAQLYDAAFKVGKSFTDTGYYRSDYDPTDPNYGREEARYFAGEGNFSWQKAMIKPGSEFQWEPRNGREIASGDTVNEFYDYFNGVHFYILDKSTHDGRILDGETLQFLSYTVGVLHDDGTAVDGKLEFEEGGFEGADEGNYAVQKLTVKHTGADAVDIIRLSAFGKWIENADDVIILNNLFARDDGEDIKIEIYILAKDGPLTEFPDDLAIKAGSETNAEKYNIFPSDADEPLEFTITYNGNGSTSGAMDPVIVEEGSSHIIRINAFTRTGYTFVGWKINDTGDILQSGITINNVSANINVVAQWSINKYNVTYNANYGTGSMDADTDLEYNSSYTIKENTFIRDGYAFNGWNTTASGSGTAYADKGTFIIPANNVALYAQWLPVVRLDANGGTGVPATYTIKPTDTVNDIPKPTPPSNPAQVFIGWKLAGVIITDADLDPGTINGGVLVAQYNLVNKPDLGNEFLNENVQKFPDMWDFEKQQTKPAFSNVNTRVICEEVWIEVPCDVDGDGQRDLIRARFRRPIETKPENGGLMTPVLAEVTPYSSTFTTLAAPFSGKVDEDFAMDNPDTRNVKYADIRYDGPTYKDLLAKNFGDLSEWGIPAARVKAGSQPEGASTANWNALAWQGYFIPLGYTCAHLTIIGSNYGEGFLTYGDYAENLCAASLVDWLNGRLPGYTNPTDDILVEPPYWATGEVAMGGQSYNGTLPFAAAITGVEGLKTIIPFAPVTSSYEYYRANGAVYAPGGYQGEDVTNIINLCFGRGFQGWNANPPTPGSPVYPTPKVWERYWDYIGESYELQDRKTGDYSMWWDGRNQVSFMPDIVELNPDLGMILFHGYNDYNVKFKHTAMVFEMAKELGITAKAIFHQGAHASPYNHNGLDFFPDLHKWLDHYLYDVDNGMPDDFPDVRVQSNVDITWKEYDTWPVGVYKKIYPNGANRVGSLSIIAPGTTAALSFKDELLFDLDRGTTAYETPANPIVPNYTENAQKYLGRFNTMASSQFYRWRNVLLGGEDVTTAWSAWIAPAGMLYDLTKPVNDRLMYVMDVTDSITISGTIKMTAKVKADKKGGVISAMLVDYGSMRRYGTGTTNTGTVVLPNGENANLVSWSQNTDPTPAKIISRGSVDIQNPNYDGDKIWIDYPEQNWMPDYTFQTTAIDPGTYYPYTWELDVTEYTVLAGHKLGLILFGTDAEYTTRPFSPTEFTVEIGPETYLSLPIAPNTITVTLNANGGSVTPNTIVVTPGEAYGTLPTPTNPGYIFKGWFTTASGGDPVTESSLVPIFVSTPITLYAQWERTTGGGGSSGGSSNASISPSKADYETDSGKDISVTLNRNGRTLKDLTHGDYTLKEGTDYTISGNTVTIKDSYLATLPVGTQTITFVMSSGNSPVLTITVKGAEEVEEVETGPTYKPMAPLHSAGTVVDATKTNNKLVMGDDELEFPAVKIGGYNWIKLRDFAVYLTGTKKQFSISYDQSTQIIDIRTGGNYQPLGDELENNLTDVERAIASPQRLRVNGEFIDVAAYNIKGYNYFRMRDLAIILNFAIDYDDASGLITLDLDNPYWE